MAKKLAKNEYQIGLFAAAFITSLSLLLVDYSPFKDTVLLYSAITLVSINLVKPAWTFNYKYAEWILAIAGAAIAYISWGVIAEIVAVERLPLVETNTFTIYQLAGVAPILLAASTKNKYIRIVAIVGVIVTVAALFYSMYLDPGVSKHII